MRFLVALATALAVSIAAPCRAQTTDVQPSPQRQLPDYDGRGPEPARVDDVALWPFRIILSPLYFTSEYILREPIGALTTAAERAKLPEALYDFFAFGPHHKIGFAPVGFVELGFVPSVGGWFFWNDAFTKGNDVRLHIELWPDEWYAGSLTDRFTIDDSRTFQLRATTFKRPDEVFYGLGPSSRQSSQSRFTESHFDASAMFEQYIWRATRFAVTAGVRKVTTSPGHYGDDPSLEKEAATGVFAIPYGFDRSYLEPYGRVLASLDTRKRKTNLGSGIRVQAQAEGGADVEHAPASGWIRWGGTATAFLDLGDHGRVLSLAASASFADPLENQPIPFTELVMLGGDNWMHGFFPGRLLDRSAAVAQLQYSWPVAPWLDGTIEGAVGNVFGAHLDGFDPKLLRVSAGIGLTTTSELPIELIVGIGSDTFERGATIDSIRVSLGVPRGF